MADQLTIAYLAIGAHTAIKKRRGLLANHFNGGELELVDLVCSHAEWLDRQFTERFEPGGWSGVWVYDVVEPFGEWVATELMKPDPIFAPTEYFESLIRSYG